MSGIVLAEAPCATGDLRGEFDCPIPGDSSSSAESEAGAAVATVTERDQDWSKALHELVQWLSEAGLDATSQQLHLAALRQRSLMERIAAACSYAPPGSPLATSMRATLKTGDRGFIGYRCSRFLTEALVGGLVSPSGGMEFAPVLSPDGFWLATVAGSTTPEQTIALARRLRLPQHFEERLIEMVKDLQQQKVEVEAVPSWDVVCRCARLIRSAEEQAVPAQGWGICPDGGCGVSWVEPTKMVTVEVWNDGEVLAAMKSYDEPGDPDLSEWDADDLTALLPRIKAFLRDAD